MSTNNTFLHLASLSSERERMIRSVFQDISLSDRKVKPNDKPKTFAMEIKEKKSQIKKLLHYKAPNTNTKRANLRKPTCLCNFERELKRSYFGENGLMTKEFPQLNKEIRYRDYKNVANLDQKIMMGPLTYYDLQETNDESDRRKYDSRINTLRKSDYFTVSNTGIGIEINNKLSSRNLSNDYKLILSEPTLNANTLTINNDPSMVDINKQDIDNVNSNTHNTTGNNTNHYYNSKSMTNRTDLCAQKEVTKKLAKSILFKAQLIKSTQENMGKKLYKIIDRAHLDKPIDVNIKQDIKIFTEKKINKKISRNKPKNFVIQGPRTQDDYTGMKKKTAEMLKMSDGINKLTEHLALDLGNELSKDYWKKTKGDRYSMPLKMVKEQIRYQNGLRNKINNKTFLMKKMEFNLNLKKNHLYNQIKYYDQ